MRDGALFRLVVCEGWCLVIIVGVVARLGYSTVAEKGKAGVADASADGRVRLNGKTLATTSAATVSGVAKVAINEIHDAVCRRDDAAITAPTLVPRQSRSRTVGANSRRLDAKG